MRSVVLEEAFSRRHILPDATRYDIDIICIESKQASQSKRGAVRRWFVYMVECVDGTIYTGCSVDVERRVQEHNSGTRGAKYTRSRRPVTLRWAQQCSSRSEALRAEARIKQLSRKEKLQIIEEGQ